MQASLESEAAGYRAELAKQEQVGGCAGGWVEDDAMAQSEGLARAAAAAAQEARRTVHPPIHHAPIIPTSTTRPCLDHPRPGARQGAAGGRGGGGGSAPAGGRGGAGGAGRRHR